MANERALGISFIYAAQTWRQFAVVYGEQDARALLGLTNVLVVFGGSKDAAFNREISDLIGTTRVSRRSWQSGRSMGVTSSGEDIPIIRPEEIRRLPERRALVLAENGKPIIADLRRCIDGPTGRTLLDDQANLRRQVTNPWRRAPTAHQATNAVRQARTLAPSEPSDRRR
jgi:type IV secretion system protein VirD4